MEHARRKLTYLFDKRCFSIKANIFVPKHAPVLACDISALKQFIDETSKLLVLTGAGISTESGLYRKAKFQQKQIGQWIIQNFIIRYS